MTILQMKYVITVSQSASIREASGKLFVSQPAISAAIRDLENEIGFRIFERNNRGIVLSAQGEEFLEYAKKAVNQYDLVEKRYKTRASDRITLSISMQHYVFAVKAFAETVKTFSSPQYSVSVRETRTMEVLDDVKSMRSSIGIISYSRTNREILRKLIRSYGLKFTPLMKRDTYIYIHKDHPLASAKEVSVEDLREYPNVSFEQSDESEFYLGEESLGDYEFDKIIKTNDRATSVELLLSLKAYSIGTGNIIESDMIARDIVSVRLKEEDRVTIGYITVDGYRLKPMEQKYLEELEKYREPV